MSYNLIKDLVSLVEVFEEENPNIAQGDVPTFVNWWQQRRGVQLDLAEPDWKGKSKGRSADSVINTSLVHLYRYAKQHAKDAIHGSSFATADELFYLISLLAEGRMTKSALIKYNVHEKPVGIQIINRLISKGFVAQTTIEADKRNRMIELTHLGKEALDAHLQQMRLASKNVTAPLDNIEKMHLIRLLLKMEHHHQQKAG